MKGFKNLTVWQKRHELVLSIYKGTKDFPLEERFCLIQQMRRSAISIAANIAEGSKRKTDRDYCHFLNMSEGSLEKLKYYLILNKDLKYMRGEVYQKLFLISEEVGRLLEVISQIPYGDDLNLGSGGTFVYSDLSGVFMR